MDYGIREGLAASKVYCVAEDKSGHIWLGTVNGASRFDGHRFENFSTAHGLAPEGVKTIYQDSAGTLWFGHYEGGITRYTNGRFEQVVLSGLRGQGDIYEFFESRQGEMWIASNGHGAIFIPDAETNLLNPGYQQFMGAEGLGDRVFDLCLTADKSLYFVTDVGIKKLEDGGKFSFYRPGEMSNMFQLTCMFEDTRGMRWFGTHNGGLYKYAPGNSDIEIIDVMHGLAHNFVIALHEDHSGNIWVGTYGGGISVISPNQNITTFNSKNGLPDLKIQSLSSDRENNVLIGTNDNGLLLFNSFQFEHYPLPDSFGARRYNAIAISSDNHFYIGTEKGLVVTDSKWNILRLFDQDQGLFDPNVNAIAIDKDGTVWLGTEFGGLFSLDARREIFSSHYFINQYINQNKVTDLRFDHHNNLWIGTLDGLLKINANNGELTRYSQRNGLNGNHISAVYPLRSGDVLVGMVGRGAARISGDSAYSILESGTPGCFLEDAQKLIWVGMESHGVHLMENEEAKVHLTVDDGLLSNSVSTIDQDVNGNIWIGSVLGVSRFDKKSIEFVHYGYSAGFEGVEVKDRSSVVTGADIWYGTANGIYRNRVKLEKSPFELGQLAITAWFVNDEELAKIEFSDLAHDQNEWRFEYKTVSLSDPGNVWYRTLLEGYDQQWSDWTRDRSVKYAGLPEGKYKFHLQAKNRWGEARLVSTPMEMEIHPPWYRTNTFYALSSLAVLLILVLYIKLRERKLMHEKRVLAEKVRSRTREVVEKSEELEKKNNDILDSINYARRIQEAILIPQSEIESYGLDSFIFFQPKDIVSGDFYWFNKSGDKVMFAAVDCTGHGVPGAFMSVVGYSLLDKIAGELEEPHPEIILNELSLGVEKFLRQKENETIPKDGMDMALVVYDKVKRVLEFSGAFNPLYLIRAGVVVEYKADRFPVGSYQQDEQKEFTRHTIDIQAGDTIYVFSDGFVDQFGGPDYKKFKSRQFKLVLSEIAHLPVSAQSDFLERTLSDWKGTCEQLDDILVIGVQF